MRFISIDLGDVRTGLAIGDDVTCIASPLMLVEVRIDRNNGADLLETLAITIEEHLGEGGEGELVIGLPLNMDGTEGPRAKLVRAFSDKLAERTGRPIHLFDERLTSVEADDRMAQSGLTHKQKKNRRDAIAAAAILEGFLRNK